MSKYAPHSGRLSQPKASSSTVCQKCLQQGHYTYECKNPRPYVSRPSRTQQLENPKVREKMKNVVEVPDEFKNKPTGLAGRILEEKEKARSKLQAETEDVGKVMEKIKKRKKGQKERSGSSKKQRRRSSSSSDSDSSSTSDTSSSTSSSSSSRSSSSSASSSSKDSRRVEISKSKTHYHHE